jgi:hypothetical protein
MTNSVAQVIGWGLLPPYNAPTPLSRKIRGVSFSAACRPSSYPDDGHPTVMPCEIRELSAFNHIGHRSY